MTNLILGVLVSALCAYRAARVVAVDTITDPFRYWLHRRGYFVTMTSVGADVEPRPHRMLVRWAYGLVSCPYCIGFWFSLATWWCWRNVDGSHVWIAAAAVAGVQTVLQSRTSE